MINLHNISFKYPGETEPAVNDISLSIATDQVISIIGANGSGKTTLGLLIAGILHPSSGKVLVKGLNTVSPEHRFELRKTISIVFQNPEDQIITTSIETELAFGPENLSFPPEMIRKQLAWSMNFFNFSKHIHSNPCHLSGGEKELLALASIFTMAPQVIILDEPTCFLDFQGRRKFYNYIEGLHRKHGVGIINITQNESETQGCDRVLLLEKGRLAFDGSPSEIQETQAYKRLLKYKRKAAIPVTATSSYNTPNGETVIQLQSLKFSYGEESDFKMEIDQLSFQRGQPTGLVGSTGSGKTTLLQILGGLEKPLSGKVLKKGRTGILFQFPEKQLFSKTVIEDVQFGPQNLGNPNPETIASEYLDIMNIPQEYFQRSPFHLSLGEQRKVGIAGVLSTQPDIALLDEPTIALDSKSIAILVKVLKKLIAVGTTLIIASHDMEFLNSLVTRVIYLEKGKVRYDGTREELFYSPKLTRQLGLSDKIIQEYYDTEII
ncbi:ATP-binding cassette domain-containing protein [bacterium]|nr:ATP-binding cassette domain-containing protein [bacterium]